MRFTKLKQNSNALDFDDLLLKTLQILRENKTIATRQAAKYDLVLVDEYQDTDPVQMEIVTRLCGTEMKRGKLFAVGDIKQSIYRFRRANPSLFFKLTKDIP